LIALEAPAKLKWPIVEKPDRSGLAGERWLREWIADNLPKI
jgi:hypothetical protein